MSIIKRLKIILFQIYGIYLLNHIIMKIPSHHIRLFFIKRIIGAIGKGSSILLNVEIRDSQNIFIGNNSIINQHVLLDGRGGRLSIGDNVDIAQETNIWTLEHDPNDDYHNTKGGEVIIEDYVWIASRVTILPGVTIGKGAVIASNSVVTKDVKPMSIVAGIPAKEIGTRKSKLKYTLNYQPKFR